MISANPLPEAKLCGADIASVSLDLLQTLHVSTVEDRERLLSAIYNELHPPTRLTQRLDALLGTGLATDTQTTDEFILTSCRCFCRISKSLRC